MTLVGIIQKVLETPRPNAANGKAKRTRRSPRYAEKLLLAYFGVFLIVIVSLVPGTWRPHTGAGGSMEHLAAYTLVATAFGFGLANTRQAFVYGIGLTAVAGLLEELQHFSPGRTPNIEGCLASSSGVWLGFGMSAIVIMVLRRVQAGGI